MRLLRLGAAITVACLTTRAASVPAQVVGGTGPITVTAGTSPVAQLLPGAKLTVPVIVDLSGTVATNFASLTTGVTWTAGQLTLDSIRAAGFGSLTTNASGASASLALFNATGTTSSVTVANLFFTASGSTGGARVVLNPTEAGNESGLTLASRLRARDLDVCVAPVGAWGDANGDGEVDIIDAQQIARFTVGLSVANATALALQGDVTADATVNIIDAQQIARFSVDLSSAPRLGTTMLITQPVTSVSVSPGESAALGVGRQAQFVATPQDEAGTALNGCVPVDAWTTSDASRATVSSSGMVTGVGVGPVTISATVSGKTGSATISVFVPVAQVTLTPDTATIHMGEQLQLTATTRDENSNVLSRTVTFITSDPTVATVSSTGLVTALMVGPVTITATSEQARGVATIQVSPLAENSLSVGDTHSCALTVAGAAYCWGNNTNGQLGNGTTIASGVPVKVAAPASTAFTQIAAGGSGTCAVTTRQLVYCWGQPAGATSSSISPAPALVSNALRAVQISHNSINDCAIDAAGAALCWGNNVGGQLGTGDTVSTVVPKAVVGGLPFKSITVSLFATCALQSSGAAYCWGSNNLRSLGVAGVPPLVLSPAPVAGGLSFTSLTAGATLTCGTVATGTAYCWGSIFFGSGGAGSITSPPQLVPTPVASTVAFKSVAPGTGNDILDNTCGLATDGTAYCWGSNSSGQIGTSNELSDSCEFSTRTFGCTAVPVPVTTSEKFARIGVGAEQVCGLTISHQLLCWGRNESGQLGDGTTANRSTPVKVLGNLRVP
jgi:alpha-tubulin suppressor-like RCC1 family protein